TPGAALSADLVGPPRRHPPLRPRMVRPPLRRGRHPTHAPPPPRPLPALRVRPLRLAIRCPVPRVRAARTLTARISAPSRAGRPPFSRLVPRGHPAPPPRPPPPRPQVGRPRGVRPARRAVGDELPDVAGLVQRPITMGARGCSLQRGLRDRLFQRPRVPG